MSLDHLFSQNNWHTVTFEEALPHLHRFIFSYLGSFPLVKGERPQTDGKCIMLPVAKSDFPDEKEDLSNNRNLSLYLADLFHEILHIRCGTFLLDPRNYFAQFSQPALAHSIFNITEDGRIEHNAASFAREADITLLSKSNQYLTRKRPFPEALHERVMDLYLSHVLLNALPSRFNKNIKNAERETLATVISNPQLQQQGITTVHQLVKKLTTITSRVYTQPVEASIAVLPELYDLLSKAFPQLLTQFPSPLSPFAPLQTSGSASDNPPQQPQVKIYLGFRGDAHDFSQGERKGKTVTDLVGDYKLPKKDTQKAAHTPKEEKKYISKKTRDPSQTPRSSLDNTLLPSQETPRFPGVGPDGEGRVEEERSVTVITYDDLRKAYLHLHTVYIRPYTSSNPTFVAALDKYASQRDDIISHFERLRLNQIQRVFQSREPHDLNIEAVLEVLAAPALRTTAAIFDSFHIHRRDALEAVLLDISGSTGSTLNHGMQVIEVEKIAAALISQGLTAIGDTVLLYAFSTNGRGTTLYPLTSIENLGALRPEHANADGVAIRGVTAELLQHDAKQKTLYVISDGRPVGSGSSGDPVIDTSMAFMEAEASGIRTVYLNVDNHASDYFPILSRHCTFAQSIRDPRQLPFVVESFVTEHG